MELLYKDFLPKIDNAIITVRVGQENKEDISVHENVIRQSSEFMVNALKDPWLEAEERVINLPTIDASAFTMYYWWLLTGKVYNRTLNGDGSSDGVLEKFHCELCLLRNALHLGHYLLDTKFVDTLCDALIQATINAPRNANLPTHILFPVNIGESIYEQAPENSPVKKLVVELIAWTAPSSLAVSLGKDYSYIQHDFYVKILEAMVARFAYPSKAQLPLVGWKTSCEYHSHGEDKKCYRSEFQSDPIEYPAKKRPAPPWDNTDPESPSSGEEIWKERFRKLCEGQ